MKTKITSIVLAIGMAILLMLCINLYIDMNKLSSINSHNIATSNDTIKILRDKYNRIIVEKKSYEISLSDAKSLNDSLKGIIKNYKPTVIVQWKTKLVYKDTINITYDTIVPFKFEYDFTYKNKWILISGISRNTGIDINLIEIPNAQSLIIGYKKDGFFKPRYANVSIVNSNPHIQFDKLDSYIIKPNKTIFNKWWLWTGVGVIGGILILK